MSHDQIGQSPPSISCYLNGGVEHSTLADIGVLVVSNPFSAGIDFRRQNLTSVDVRFWRLKSIPALKDQKLFTVSPCINLLACMHLYLKMLLVFEKKYIRT